MTSGDPLRSRAIRILENLSEQMDEALMARLIDQPIDEAAEAFPLEKGRAHSHELFHKTVAAFFHWLHEKALRCGCSISPAQAHDEAVTLLEQAYQGTHLSGYDAAVADAADPAGAGISLVLARLAETVKAQERRKYQAWVFARHLGPADWDTKCAIAVILMEGWLDVMPSHLRPYPPEFWADEIPELLRTDSGIPRRLHQVVSIAASSGNFQDIISAAGQRL